MRKKGIKTRYIRGGSNEFQAAMLLFEDTDILLDGQAFSREGIISARTRRDRHILTNPFTSYCEIGKGNTSTMVDAAIMGATEIDLNFGINIATGYDGIIRAGLGGGPDSYRAKTTIIGLMSEQKGMPTIVDEVYTLCAPSELIDVVITNIGEEIAIAINSNSERGRELLEITEKTDLPIYSLEEIKDRVEKLIGKIPERAKPTDQAVGGIRHSQDDSVLDMIWMPEMAV